ncbi:FAD-dependent oxidoreductase [Compostibacter hankyongensis]
MVSRRKFFGNFGLTFVGGLLGWPVRAATAAAAAGSTTSGGILPDDNTLEAHYDLVVVGGGISGVSAAISAARNGLKVALVHNRAMFGGNSSSEVKLFPENNSGTQPWIKEGGLNDEFHTEERVRNHAPYMEGTMNAHWDLVLYEWVIREKNITHYLNTHMHKVFMKDKSRIASVFAIQLGTEKSFTLSAPLFVDATGDGVLGGLAKADHRWGREARAEYNESLAPAKADETVMGNTLFFQAKDMGTPVPFKAPDWAVKYTDDASFSGRGHSYFEGGYWWIEVGMPYHPIKDNNETRHEALRQLLGVWDHIKNGPCKMVDRKKAANYGLEFVGFWPYKRASRRIIGDYVLTQRDVQDPKSLPDAVAYGAWHIDVHVPGGILAADKESYPPPGKEANWQDLCTMAYSIPIRSLYSRNVENLMMAGRPISCSYLAFASSRVLSTGSICGQAVGVVAALAKRYHTLPREIARSHASETQQLILRQDGHIPGVENTDAADLARKAKVTAESHAALSFPEPNGERDLSLPHAQLFPVSAGQIEKVALLLRSTRNTPTRIRVGLRPAPDVGDFRAEEDLGTAEVVVPAHHDGWVQADFGVHVEPGKLYYIHTDKQPGIFWKAFREKEGDPNRLPPATTAAFLPEKTGFGDKSSAFRELFPDVELKDIPGAGKAGHWRPLTMGYGLCMRLTPDSHPYGPENVARGANRPDKWSNIWVSDPSRRLPASLQLSWPSPVACNTVQLTFDTDQNRRVTLPLFRYPDCVKDYSVEYHDGSGWKQLLKEEGNYMRRRVHRFDEIRTDRLRINILATNGGPSARVYEVRVYNDKEV